MIILFLLLFAPLLIPLNAFPGEAPGIRSLYVIDYATSLSDTLRSPQGIFFDCAKRELYVSDAGKKRILIYDDNGRFLKQIRYREESNPVKDIVALSDGRIFLTSLYGAEVAVLDQNGEILGKIDFSNGFAGPRGKLSEVSMSLGPDGMIYLLTNLRGIVKIDPKTMEVTPVPLDLKDEKGKPRLKIILVMTVDREGRFLFGEMRPGSVVVFRRDGAFEKRFGESGGGPRQISRPTGITVDGKGRIYVLSTIRDMVLVYDGDGRYLREWGGPGTTKGLLYNATRIIYDGRNRLYTLEPVLNRVQVFKIEEITKSGRRRARGLPRLVADRSKGSEETISKVTKSLLVVKPFGDVSSSFGAFNPFHEKEVMEERKLDPGMAKNVMVNSSVKSSYPFTTS